MLRGAMSKLARSLAWGVRAIAIGVALHAFGTLGLAYAVSHAPNGPSALASDDPVPSDASGRVESRRFSLESGGDLSTWVLEPRSAPRGTLVLLHGVRLDKHSMLPAAQGLADAGYRVVLPDLRGHGHSAGGYLTYGVGDARDVSGLLDALEREGIELGPVGVHGFSYGGATALALAATEPRVRAVVAVSSFSSLRGVVRDYVSWQAPWLAPAVPNAWLDSAVDMGGLWAGFDPDRAEPAECAARARVPLLVIHGAEDPQIPVKSAHEIQRAAGPRARLLVLPGETHASILADRRGEVLRAARSWFDEKLLR